MYEVILKIVTALNYIPAALFAYVLINDLFMKDETEKEAFKKKYLMWSYPFIGLYAYVVLNVLFMMVDLPVNTNLWWKLVHTAIGAWYIFEVAKVNKFDLSNIRRKD